MKHLLFIILFGGALKADAQFMPGTPFYYRNMELCDSINRLRTITFLSNDSLFGQSVFPQGYPVTTWDTINFYRCNFKYKLNVSDFGSTFNSNFTGKSTTDLSEGTNLYYTAARFNSAFTGKNTDGLAEGSTNLYFTNTRARSAISLTTTGTSGAATYLSGVLNVPNYTPAARSFNNAPTPTIQTVAAAANGDQLSSTRDVAVSYSATIVSTATIAGNASGYFVLEICSTNSATAANWIEISRVSNGQAVSLAVTLQAVSTGGGAVTGIVPAGFYRRIRSVNVAGTPTFTYNSGQEVLQ